MVILRDVQNILQFLKFKDLRLNVLRAKSIRRSHKRITDVA
jgi:hypothetical protein